MLRPAEEGFAVVRDDDGAWRVDGHGAPSAVVAMADLTNEEAIEYVQDRFRRMGVERALRARRRARGRHRARRPRRARVPSRASADGAAGRSSRSGRRRSRPTPGELDDGALGEAVRRGRRRARRTVTTSCSCARVRSRPGCPRSGSPNAPPTSARSRPSPRSVSRGSWRGSAPSSPSTACVAGQVLLTPHDFGVRTQYLHAREHPAPAARPRRGARSSTRTTPSPTTRSATATTTASPRSSRTSCGADLLVLLTDTPGLFTADPRLDAEASLIEEIVEVDAALEAVAGGAGTDAGERRHGEQARGGEDRRVVGRARGDRRAPTCPTS